MFAPPPEALPSVIEAEIEKSVQQFRARLGVFAQAGWIAEYRNELERIARVALTTTNA